LNKEIDRIRTFWREECYDLVGIIQKGRAGEFLSAGRFAEAVSSAESEILNLLKDGWKISL